MAENSESCRVRGGALLVNAGGGRRERRFGGVCCRHAGGREAAWVFVNKIWGFPVLHTLEGIGPRRAIALLLLILERDLRFGIADRENRRSGGPSPCLRIADREAGAAPAPTGVPRSIFFFGRKPHHRAGEAKQNI